MTAVVTGLGVVAPNGIGAEEYWPAVLRGESGIGPIRRFDPSGYPVKLAGEVRAPVAERLPGLLSRQTDRWTHLGLLAAELALADAGVDPAGYGDYDLAVTTASSSGGTEFGQREIERLWSCGPGFVGAYQSIAWFYAATTGQISIRHGLRGPCGVVVAEQAGGLDAVGQARRLLRDAEARVVLAGGTDASLCPYGLVAQLSTGLLSTGENPHRAYLPFDTAARGYLPGEGGAMLVVEDAAAARERGAHRYGEIAGYGASFDPEPGTGPPGLRRAVERAVIDAGMAPEEIDVIFADAAAVPALDQVEADVLAFLFEPYGVPVTAPKTMTGRLYAGGAALDLATALLAIRDSVIPPTVGVTDPVADHGLDLVLGEPRSVPVRAALVIARGHGGFNAAVVVRAVE